MRDVKKIVLVTLEPSEPAPAAETLSASVSSGSAAAAAVSRHTASCFQRSARRVRRSGVQEAEANTPPGDFTPAPPAVSVRFQLVVISFVSRGFPRLFRLLLSGPGFGSRSGLSGPSVQQPFDRVQVSENRVKPRTRVQVAAPAAVVRSIRCVFRFAVRLAFASLPARFPTRFRVRRPPRLRLAVRSVRFRSGQRSDAAVRSSGLPPGPGLLFRSFAVRFVHGFVSRFRLVRFSSF